MGFGNMVKMQLFSLGSRTAPKHNGDVTGEDGSEPWGPKAGVGMGGVD